MVHRTVLLGALLCVCLLLRVEVARANSLGATIPRGWNTWCTEDICGIIDICTEEEIMSVAKALRDEGLQALGYEWISLDDCWSATNRTADGKLQPAADQFPRGMKALADDLHALGFKFSLYTDIGVKTCHGNRPGLFGYNKVDAETLSSWGIDGVKTDNCARPSGWTERDLYGNWSAALKATGSDISLFMCSWGQPYKTSPTLLEWFSDIAVTARVQMDHLPLWTATGPLRGAGAGFGGGTADIIQYMATIQPSKWTKQNGWLDPDFLEGDFFTFNKVEARTEFTFWALWSSPLLFATDPRNMSAEYLEILSNKEVLAVNEDPLWTSGDLMQNATDGGQVWAKPLSDGSHAVVLYNSNIWNKANITVTAEWGKVGVNSTRAAVRDLWAHRDLGTFDENWSASLEGHASMMLKVTPVH